MNRSGFWRLPIDEEAAVRVEFLLGSVVAESPVERREELDGDVVRRAVEKATGDEFPQRMLHDRRSGEVTEDAAETTEYEFRRGRRRNLRMLRLPRHEVDPCRREAVEVSVAFER